MLLGRPQLDCLIFDLILILAVLVQLIKGVVLLFLDFGKHHVFLLQVFQNLPLVFLLVL